MKKTAAGAVALAVFWFACNPYESFDDFESWCSRLHAGGSDAFIVSIDQEAIRSDIISTWDEILVQNGGRVLGIPEDSIRSDSLMQVMEEIRMIGAWSEGDTLNFAVDLLLPPVLAPNATHAQIFAAEYRQRLRMASDYGEAEEMDPTTYCLYTGIDVYFSRLSVHSRGDTAHVETEGFQALQEMEG